MSPETPHHQICPFDASLAAEEETTKSLPKMEGSPQDQEDMTRMGKTQELKVPVSIFGVTWKPVADTSEAQLSSSCCVEFLGRSPSNLGVYTHVSRTQRAPGLQERILLSTTDRI